MSNKNNPVVVCVLSGKCWDVWLDDDRATDIGFRTFLDKSEAQQYAEDLSVRHNAEIVYP